MYGGGSQQGSCVSLPSDWGMPISIQDLPGSGNSLHRGGGRSGAGGKGEGGSVSPIYAGNMLYKVLCMGKESSQSGAPIMLGRLPGLAVNPCVKRPFKHDIRTPSQSQGWEPSQMLKEVTALATLHVTQLLTTEVDALTRRKGGRLQKGRLKPMYPVSFTGPSIRQCRGILAETRSYSASASRTLQRRRQIVGQLRTGALKLEPKAFSPDQQDTESMHRVSAASSMENLPAQAERGGGVKGEEEGEEDFQEELASMEKDGALFQRDILSKDCASKEDGQDARRFLNPSGTGSLPPLSMDQDIKAVQNPDLSTAYLAASSPPFQSRPDSAADARNEGSLQPSNQHPTSVSCEGQEPSPMLPGKWAAVESSTVDKTEPRRQSPKPRDDGRVGSEERTEVKDIKELTMKESKGHRGQGQEQYTESRGLRKANKEEREESKEWSTGDKDQVERDKEQGKENEKQGKESEEQGKEINEQRKENKEHQEKNTEQKIESKEQTKGTEEGSEDTLAAITSSTDANMKGDASCCRQAADSPQPSTPQTAKRPLSARINPSHLLLTSSPAKARPHTAAVSAKTVRFADHAHSSDGRRMSVTKPNGWLGRNRGGVERQGQ